MNGVMLHGVLALVGLSSAYMVWTNKDETKPELGEETLVDCRDSKLDAIGFEEEGYQVRIAIKAKGASPAADRRIAWVETQRTPKAGEKSSERFAGGPELDEYFKKIAPLRVLRSLGNIETKRLKDFALDKPKTKLSLRCDGKSHAFVIGGSTYGSGDRYMQAAGKNGQGTGAVYLLHADILRDLRSAEYRLMQRQLHRFKRTEVETVSVEAFGKKRQLLQRNRLDSEKAEWVDAAEPARRNELYGNWLDRIDRLTVQKYLGPKQKPGDELDAKQSALGAAVPVLTLDYADSGGDSLGKLELMRLAVREANAQESGEATEASDYYARSETTFSWVKLPRSLAGQVEEDLRAVVGMPADSKAKDASPSKAASPAKVANPHHSNASGVGVGGGQGDGSGGGKNK